MSPVPVGTIVIPAYNRVAWVCEAARCALGQTVSNIEVVVVDDGSTEDVAGGLDPLRRADPRLRYHRQPNQGPGSARNTGISLARGQFVGFLDSDDLMAPRWFESQLDFVARHPDTDIALCQNLYFHETPAGERDFYPNQRPIPAATAVRDLMFGNFIPICNALVRRSLFDICRFDPSLPNDQDWDLWARLALSGARYAAHHEVLAAVRLHPGQRSQGGAAIPRCRLRIMAGLESEILGGRANLGGTLRSQCLAILELRRMAQYLTLREWVPALRHLGRGLSRSPVSFAVALGQKAAAFLTKRHQIRAQVYGRTPLFQGE